MNLICNNCREVFVSKYRSRKFCSIVCSNRFNLNNKKRVRLPQSYSSELAEFFGILLGDGSVTKYYTKVHLNLIADKGYEDKVCKLIDKIFSNVNLCIMQRPARGTYEIQISSKEVSDYIFSIGFDPKTRTIPFWIISNVDFTKRTIRGLFDTEGSIGIKKLSGKSKVSIYKQLTFTNKNSNILNFITQSLERLGYKPNKNATRNVYISNAKDIKRYFQDIGTSNPKLEKKLKIQ